ncbi:hypothetical protein A3760_13640 [Oleiphilus sp. HI0122]|nr:hypothetical protein A3760_13640 [Oleiphilus sp. HI0122]
MFYALIAVIVNVRFYSFFTTFQAAELSFEQKVAEKAALIKDGSLKLTDDQLADLLLAAANRDYEIIQQKWTTAFNIILFSISLFSIPVTQQLTRRSSKDAVNGAT